MPRPIKDGNNFEINRSIVYNGKDINFHMPSMSACIKHYEIGFQISGSHHVYSTDGERDILRGYCWNNTSWITAPDLLYQQLNA